MIPRYSMPEMGKIWEPENKFRKWLDVEIAACEAWAELGEIPKKSLAIIKKRAGFNIKRIDKIEQTVKHDVIAFLTSVAEHVGSDSRYVHKGLTSSDIVDTSLAIMMREAADIIINDIKELMEVLKSNAYKYKNTLRMGRSHGIHAEPTTFGLTFALWYEEMKRNLVRMQTARETINYGQLSGPVGTFSSIPPFIEKHVCKKLGLKPAPVSTQIIQRDRHAEYLTTLALLAGSIEKFATEIRHLQRTEVREAEEAFSEGQKGSSAMPHKRNPITCERLCGLARVVRANALAGMEDVCLWHERDISHSSVERVVLPDSTTLADYLLVTFRDLLEHLAVHPERMRKNLEASGVIYSQPLLLALARKGVVREEAYRWVQREAMVAWEEDRDFRTLVTQNKNIRKHLSPKEIGECFQVRRMLRHVDFIFRRALRHAKGRAGIRTGRAW